MRILSGIQPSGPLHIGNYLGAIRQYVALQEGNDAYYFVADYHALTSVRDPALLRKYVSDVLIDLLSLGLDPDRVVLFAQSDVPETVELSWLLTSVTPMGWLEKCVSYKDKIQQGLPAEHGLFAYPVLQAADILLYDADLVPVGQDQKQHLEITRDVAERFNHVYGGKKKEVFRLPKPYILDSVAVVPGLDGRKMSKSYSNTIEIFDEPAAIRKKVKKFVTDSTPVEAPKDPDADPLFGLFKLFAKEADRDDAAGAAPLARRRLQAGRQTRGPRRGRTPIPRGGDRLRRGQDEARRGLDRDLRRGPRTPGGVGRAPGTGRRGPRRRGRQGSRDRPQGSGTRPRRLRSRLILFRRDRFPKGA